MLQKLAFALSVLFCAASLFVSASLYGYVGDITFPNEQNKEFKKNANISVTFWVGNSAKGDIAPDQADIECVVAIRKTGTSGIITSFPETLNYENHGNGSGVLSPPPGDYWEIAGHTIYLIVGSDNLDTQEITIVEG